MLTGNSKKNKADEYKKLLDCIPLLSYQNSDKVKVVPQLIYKVSIIHQENGGL